MSDTQPQVQVHASAPPNPPFTDYHKLASHFVLRKGSLQAPECVDSGDNGVVEYKHPITKFDIDVISATWGFGEYFIHFFSRDPDGKWIPRGGTRKFGLQAPKDEPDDQALATHKLPPTPLAGDLGTVLALAESLKGLAAADTERQVRMAQENQSLQVQMMQSNMGATLGMIDRMFGHFSGNAQNGQIAGALTTLATEIANIKKRLDDEEDDESDLEDEAKAFVQDVARNGLGSALSSYATTHGTEQLFHLLPYVQQKVPDLLGKFMAMIAAKKEAAAVPRVVEMPTQPVVVQAPSINMGEMPKVNAS